LEIYQKILKTYLNKKFINYKIIFSIAGLSVIIIIASIFLLGPIQDNNNSVETEQKEKQAIEIVQSYRGIDGKGENMLDAFRAAFDEVYPGEDIVGHPGTKIFWSAFEDIPFSNTYQVHLEIKTPQENSLFVWKVNLDDKKVWSNQAGAQGMLNRLDQT